MQRNRNARTSGAGKRRSGTGDDAGSGAEAESHHRRQRSRQELLARCRLVGADAEVAPRPESPPDFRLHSASYGYCAAREAAICVDDRRRKQQEFREQILCPGRRLDRAARTTVESWTGHPRTRRRRLLGLGSGQELLDEEGQYRRSGSTSRLRVFSRRDLGRAGRPHPGQPDQGLQGSRGRLVELDPGRTARIQAAWPKLSAP